MPKQDVSRSFDLSHAEIKALAEQHAKDKAFPVPYRTGAYRHILIGIAALGVNKPHPLAKVHEAFKRAAGAEWYGEWARKENRNDKTGKDADGRFLQNLKVLQRTKDYGRKLLQVGRRILKTKGCVIDLSRDGKGGILVCLNTRSDKPQKAGKASQKPSGESKTTKKARKASKVAKGVRANRKVVQSKPSEVAVAPMAEEARN
jgi:hypothetical protein